MKRNEEMAMRIRNMADWLNKHADQIVAGCPELCTSLAISFEVMLNDGRVDDIPTVKIVGQYIDKKGYEQIKEGRKNRISESDN